MGQIKGKKRKSGPIMGLLSLLGMLGMLVGIWALPAPYQACAPVLAGDAAPQGKVLHLDARGVDLMLQIDPNLLLIDVRTPGELTGPLGEIPQSRNVTMQEIEENPEQFPHDKTLVLICRSGHRSLKAAELLAGHGYVVYTVDGGMRAWRKLHPESSTPANKQSPTAPAGSNGTPGMRNAPPEKGSAAQPQEKKFLDDNMGC